MCSSNPKNSDKHTNQSGVGARQENGQAPEWGGGYQNNYIDLKLSIEAKSSQKLRDEILSLNLPDVWNSLLDIIEPEQFLAIWLLMSDYADDRDSNRLHVPSFRKFETLQRNLLIKSLANTGAVKPEIHATVKKIFGPFSIKTLERVLNS